MTNRQTKEHQGAIATTVRMRNGTYLLRGPERRSSSTTGDVMVLAVRSSSTAPRGALVRVAVPMRRSELRRIDGRMQVPSYDVRELRAGVVHLGVGNFHRAHQAAYLDRLAELGARDWAVLGVGVHRDSQRPELLAQDCLYTLTELSEAGPTTRVVGVLQDYLSTARQLGVVRAALEDPATQLVTVTVTAPTYADAGAGSPVFGLLADALGRRRRLGLEPFTVLSCDNLPANGDALRRCVREAASSPRLAAWIDTAVAFPNSMVDRITPPASRAHRRELQRAFGIDDRAPVVTEPFSRWVVEDAFSGERPPLEDVGVHLVTDVGPHVQLKMRVLNAGHLALGFLGARTPCRTTDAAMAHPVVGRDVKRLLMREVVPMLDHVPGVDRRAYVEEVLGRFSNPAVADPLVRLRRRGSVRMSNYLLPSLDEAVRQGRDHRVLSSVVAAWIDHLRLRAAAIDSGQRGATEVHEELADPASHRLVSAARSAQLDVRPFLAAAEGFEMLRLDRGFVTDLQGLVTTAAGGASAAAS